MLLSSRDSLVGDEEVMRIDNSHQDDAFAATEDAVDERLQEIGNEAESRFAEKEAARQEARIANGYILFAFA